MAFRLFFLVDVVYEIRTTRECYKYFPAGLKVYIFKPFKSFDWLMKVRIYTIKDYTVEFSVNVFIFEIYV